MWLPHGGREIEKPGDSGHRISEFIIADVTGLSGIYLQRESELAFWGAPKGLVESENRGAKVYTGRVRSTLRVPAIQPALGAFGTFLFFVSGRNYFGLLTLTFNTSLFKRNDP